MNGFKRKRPSNFQYVGDFLPAVDLGTGLLLSRAVDSGTVGVTGAEVPPFGSQGASCAGTAGNGVGAGFSSFGVGAGTSPGGEC